jgi:hypothetical protein
MEESRFVSDRIIDGKRRRVIVDKTGKIINNNPSKEELKNLKKEPYKIKRKGYTKKQLLGFIRQFYEENGRIPATRDFSNSPKYPSSRTYHNVFGSWNNAIREEGLWEMRYNPTHTCDRCGKNFSDVEKSGGYPLQECDEKGYWNERWDCPACWQKYDSNSQHNAMKSVANCRTGNQNQDHPTTKGDKYICLACILYGYENLNEKYDNYTTEIDCQDPKTGLCHQIQGRRYNPKYEQWRFTHLNNEWFKEYEDMVCFCKSDDGKRIERIYRFPHSVIEGRSDIIIYKNPSRGVWYEIYRYDDELKKANDIQRILDE